MSHHTPVRGKQNLDALIELIEHEEIETVITAFPDTGGRRRYFERA